jgi:hypothetical protein
MEQSGAELFMFSTTSRPRRVAGIPCRSSTMRSLALAKNMPHGELVGSVVPSELCRRSQSQKCSMSSAMVTPPVALQEFDVWLCDGSSSGHRAWLGAVSRVACGAR